MSKSRLKKLIKKKQNVPSESEKPTPSLKSSAKPTLQTRTRRKRPASSESATSESDAPKREPRIHAAPPRVHAAPTLVEDAAPIVEEATTVVTEPNEIPTSSVESAGVEETVATAEIAEGPQGTQTGVEASPTTEDNTAVESTPSSDNSPRVHAAPPSAFANSNDAGNGLGSAVIAPPPNYGTGAPASDAPSTGRKNERGRGWNDDEEDKEKSRNKTRRNSRRGRQRDWTMDSFGEGNSQPRPQRTQTRRKKGKAKASPKAKAIKRRVMINETITVSELAHSLSQKAGAVIKSLMAMGEMATMNDALDFETAQLVAAEFDYEAVDTSFQEDAFLISTEEETQEEGPLRPPVVTIMGHVDHGKTTLLDTIRKANVAAGEAGGITQHTSAYQVTHEDHLITFIDTPGHEAFTAMRARGAQVTDIVILVVAADDGPMPQTIEALNHARASGVQLMVAVNKCDKPGANPDKVRQDMMRYELVSEEYGGDTIFVNVSALHGEGIDELLENIILLSEMGEYRAPTDRHADGFVLEARLEKGRGAVANLLVKNGTLSQGDTLVLGNVWGRVRAMYDYNGKKIKKALPSTPIELIGLQEIPTAGDDFIVVKKPKDAKALVAHRLEEAKNQAQAASSSISLEELLRRQVEGEPVKLNLIIKSDVGGTLEAMRASIAQIDVPGTEVNILHAAIGGITESDVSLAHTYEGIIIGFNVRPDAVARRLVNQTNVEVRTYNIIYEALEDLEKGLRGLLEPELKEQWKGSAEIRETFSVPKVGTVAGCLVLDGTIARKHQIRLLREGTIVWEGKLGSLRRFKDDVREVEKGYECGINLDGFNDIKVGDQLETFMMEEEEQT